VPEIRKSLRGSDGQGDALPILDPNERKKAERPREAMSA
jgi:hypothetical protein